MSADTDATDETTQETLSTVPPAAKCIAYDACGNQTPGGADSPNVICDACLSARRERGRGHELGGDDT